MDENERPAKILTSLGSYPEINLQVFSRPINRRAISGKRGGRKPGINELQYVLDAIIYGPEDLCDTVGEYLTKCGICLQDPFGADKDVPYRNPHILSRTQVITLTSSLQNTIVMPEIENVAPTDDFFSTFSSDDHIQLTEAPDAIATPLYP